MIAAAILSLAIPSYAQDTQPGSSKPDSDLRPADGLENWTYEYDVGDLKPGTYNVLARATDAAGNVSYATPFNLIVDPASDLPIAGLVNPLPSARVGADLNVVGVCVDDDAVGRVELSLDEGDWVAARGTDYWSYYLPTSGMADGLHSIAVRGVDVNGLEGPAARVSFQLDRTKPLHEVRSPGFGAIVSGKLGVSGSVYDANGLAEVSYSMDSGATWSPLRHSYDKKAKTASFSLSLDTKKMPDGPAVLWLRSVDGVGSEGVAVFLYFIDNTRPELVLLSPADDESVNGRFYVRGRVFDTVGVESLSWTYGKDSGEVALLPGNPYFSLPFDAPAKAGPVVVGLNVADVAGNATAVKVSRKADPEADLPRVVSSSPAPGSTLEGAVRVVGRAVDDDGVASLEWRLDDGPVSSIACSGVFSFTIDGAESGPRTLFTRAIDSGGLAGPWSETPFVYSGAAPRLYMERAADASGERDFRPGVSVSTLEGRASLSGAIRAANPLVELTYSINGGAPMKLPFSRTEGGASFTVPLSASLPYGVLDVRLEAVDAYGKTGVVRVPVLAVDYSRPRAGPLLDFGLAAEPTAEAPAAIAVGDASPFVGGFVTPFDGEGIRAVSLEPATALLTVTHEGAVVRVSRVADGTTGPTLVVVETERGHRFSAGPFIFGTDAAAPAVTIREPAFGSWRSGVVDIVAETTDGDRVASADYSINGGEWTPLRASGGSYRADWDAASASGPVRLQVRAIDAAGNAAVASTAFMADAAPPEPRRVLPRDGDSVAGPALFAVKIGEGMQSLERVELGRGGAYEALSPADTITFIADPAAAPLTLRVTDKAGNASSLDLLAGLAVATEAKTAPAPLDSIKTGSSSVPEGPTATFTGADAVGALSWTAPIAADAASLAGYAARPIRASGAASLSASFAGVSPDPRKPVAAWGYAADAVNQPLSLKKAAGADTWTATMKIPARPDGPASLWVRIDDVAKGAVYATVALDYDSTPPAIEIVTPAPTGGKATATGAFTLVLRAADAAGIASLSYEYGADKGELELQSGSGDAARAFSFPPKSSQATITVKAVDGSGNRSQATVSVAYDAQADAPSVRALSPAEGAVITGGGDDPLVALLYASDEDGLSGVALSVDGVPFEASGPGPLYAVDLGAVPRGKHIAIAQATDSGGVPSLKSTLSFVRRGTAPTVVAAEGLVPGSALSDGKTTLIATAMAPNGLAKAEYAFNGGTWSSTPVPKPGADGAYALHVTPPAALPYDRAVVAVRVTDAAGLVAEDTTSFYRVSQASAPGSVVAEGVYLYDMRIDDDGRATLAPGDALGALWNGRPIRSISLEPALPFAEASFDGATIRVSATAEGGAGASAKKTVLRVTTIDGDVFESVPVIVVADSGAPAITLSAPVSGAPVRGPWIIAGEAADANGIASLEWSIDGGATWTAVETPAAKPGDEGRSAFSTPVSSDKAEGAISVLVRATDRAGLRSEALTAVAMDGSAPAIVFETPRDVDTVNGTVLVAGYAEDAFSVASIEFSVDGATWEPLEASPRGAAVSAVKGERPDGRAEPLRASFERLVDMGSLPDGGAAMAFRAVDAAGNAATRRPLDPAAPAFAVDIEADKPIVEVQIPADAEVMRSDFIVSGMAFDDDGVAELFWRLDGSEWTRLDGGNGFAVPFRLLDLADNEHLFEAYAVDLNAVQGAVASRAFRVSREEPVGRLESPDVEVTNKDVITLRGVASDANGIAEVHVSFDNGATYDAAVGTTEWSYTLDTRTVPDGVHSVYLRLVDGYGTTGFAAGLLSVDNTPPVVALDTPYDGEEGIASMTVGGRVSDGIAVRSMSLQISRIGSATPETVVELKSEGVFNRELDTRGLAPGWYNVKAIALDRAGNAAYDSRNVVVLESRKADYAELVFPAHGEPVSGRFTIDGRVVSAERLERAAITMDGQPFATAELSADGWFSLTVEPGSVEDGARTFRVEAVSAAGGAIASDPRTIVYTRDGPWVDIDAVESGDFIVGRPFLTGKAGWDVPAPGASDKAAAAAHKKLVKERRAVLVELSRDNGKTWQEASGTERFKYRLETQEYPDGTLRLLVRATFAGGRTAVRKRLVVLDTKAPEVTILRPAENGRYNGVVSMEGTASDANGLAEVSVVLRSGDKSSYEIPGFIQGSYLDAHLLGSTRYEAGLGLSFFDDNVKLQVELGQGFDASPTWDNLLGFASADTPAAELSRFGGYVLGAKLLANLAYLPFSYWFGPDWDFFSMSFAVGASFTYFSMRDSLADLFSPPDGSYMVLSGVVVQWEFAKFDFGWNLLKTIGLYIEGGLVFIPSEASTSIDEFIRPTVAFGARIGLF
ncbi:MAG: hypothetical protein CVV47_07620 [Spirochaetae bacterium HGW-Spirochaetae-3]|nr:MAG: hypothetical protein CVV47_07620 [Spirochaetae bacterium HGW-Spirochaetae-3]